MSMLSEVSHLIGERAGDLEKAQEIFTSEIRAFTTGILGGVCRQRSEPWMTRRVRIDMPRNIETEGKSNSLLSQFARAKCALRFKRGTNYQVVAEIRFGIKFDEVSDSFVWEVSLETTSRFRRIDDTVWAHWRTTVGAGVSPSSMHLDKTGTIRFALRPVNKELTPEIAFNDSIQVLEFLLTADAPLADAVDLDLTEDED